MSTQELVYNLPKLTQRSVKRKLKFAKAKAQRIAKAKMRKAKSVSIAYYRRQYYLTTARRDLQRAVTLNEDIFIATSMIAVLIGYCFATRATDFLLLFFQTAYNTANISGISMFVLSLAAFGSLTVLLGWILAFMLNIQSIALMDGIVGKQRRSIRKTLRLGLFHASRVASVWALLAALVVVPLIALAIAAYTYISVASLPLKEVISLAPEFGVISALAVLGVLLHYSLAPYVALFETELPLTQTLKRSRQLVRRRGRIFLFATYLAFVAAAAGIYLIAAGIEHLIGLPKLITGALGGLGLLMSLNGILVVLYRKRKLARKN